MPEPEIGRGSMGLQTVPCTRPGCCWHEHQGERHPYLWSCEMRRPQWKGLVEFMWLTWHSPIPSEKDGYKVLFFKASKECNLKSKILLTSVLLFKNIHYYQIIFLWKINTFFSLSFVPFSGYIFFLEGRLINHFLIIASNITDAHKSPQLSLLEPK